MSLIRADARRLPLDDGCVQCCVTSPPYFGLRDYGVSGQIGLEPTPNAYVSELVAVFREVRRVLADDGVLWLNLGDSYSGSGKGAWDKTGIQKEVYVPKPGGRETSMPKVPEGTKPKDLIGIPWRVAFALQADGWYLRSDIIWHKPNQMPESVTDRPTKAHEYLFLLAKSENYYYDAAAIAEASINAGAVVRNDCGKNARMGKRGQTRTGFIGEVTVKPTRNRRSVWTISTAPYKCSHFATFPEALVEPCVLAGSRNGDLVFDPFGGTGTVVRVARRLGRRGVATELNPEYLQIARKRIVVTSGLPLEAA